MPTRNLLETLLNTEERDAKITPTKFYGLWRGFCEYNHDPLGLGRIKARVPQIHGMIEEVQAGYGIEPEYLPWAFPCFHGSGTYDSGEFDVPLVGATVWIIFELGDPSRPVYMGSWPSIPETEREINTIVSRSMPPGKDPSMRTWRPTAGEVDTPKETRKRPEDEPTRRVFFKTPKGATIYVEDKDEAEFLRIVDRLGQTFEMFSPVLFEDPVTKKPINKGNKAQRGTRMAVSQTPQEQAYPLNTDLSGIGSYTCQAEIHDQYDPEQYSVNQEAWIKFVDAKGQSLTLWAKHNKEKVILLGKSGHYLVLDSTSGKELIRLTDKNGNFILIDSAHNDMKTLIQQDVFETSGRDKFINIGRDGSVLANNDYSIDAANDMNITLGGKFNISVTGDCGINVKGACNILAEGECKVHSLDHIDISAPSVDINSNAPETPVIKTPEAPLIEQPTSGCGTPFQGQTVTFDYNVNDDKEPTTNQEKAVAAKEAERFPAGDTTAEDATPATDEPTPPVDCMGLTEPLNYGANLTANFKLSEVSSNAAVSKYTIAPQCGLTTLQIACNLLGWCENIGEPLAAQWGRGSMLITSGFRSGSGTSQHNKGQACDVQFPGKTNQQIYDIALWIKASLPYDQLILEYGGSRPWIHISFNKDGNRPASASNKFGTQLAGNNYTWGVLQLRA